MDGCKLAYHPDRVADWKAGERIAPIHIDVGLSKGCNIRCEYCFGVLQGNHYKKGKTEYFSREPLISYMKDAGKLGVRSMGLIGEAEPTLNPHLYEAIRTAKENGIDVSLGTNGLLFDTDKVGEEALEYLTWIRFNISASSEEGYRQIHGSKHFDRFLYVVAFCVGIKRKKNLPVTIGFQSVLTPNNMNQMVNLSILGKQMGVDYHVIKQCADTITNSLGIYSRLVEYSRFREMLLKAEAQSEGSYNVIVKWDMIRNVGKRNYTTCLGPPFLLYSSGDGKLFPCGAFFKDHDEYLMGDLLEQSFMDIWRSQRYWDVIEKVKQIDVSKCYTNCRTHFINEYLWEITHPPEHVNFV